ncbi:hypothetical protein JXA85_00665 [Candidatus Woesearchaeota archaeon]|nr:hypothetical protein [Candidatus Woesearchaeota archaeon]
MNRMLQFGLLFFLLAGFSLVSLGIVQSSDMISTVSAMKDDNPDGEFVSVKDSLFDAKVLRFLKEDKVCTITDEQSELVSGAYPTETKEFEVEGETVDVLYISGNPLNREKLEEFLDIDLGNKCQVVHGNKIIAVVVGFLSPIYVS